MKIYLATGNKHKRDEMSAIFSRHTVIMPSDEGISFDPDETGGTFAENSLIKARALWDIVRQPVLADDSGICVDALEGRPGIFSARYKGGAQGQKAALLTEVDEMLCSRPDIASTCGRRCRFVCAMTLYWGLERFTIVQETLEGRLVENMEQALGEGGFGYDPVFFLEEYGKTVAQLSAEEKNRISHRAKAAALIRRYLDESGN